MNTSSAVPNLLHLSPDHCRERALAFAAWVQSPAREGGETEALNLLGEACVLVHALLQHLDQVLDVPEGCTPADAAALRRANHVLAQEVHDLKGALQRVAEVPRRAVVMVAEIQADTRADLASHLFNLAIQVEREGFTTSVSCGCSSGHIIELSASDSPTHDEYFAGLRAYLARRIKSPEVSIKEKPLAASAASEVPHG